MWCAFYLVVLLFEAITADGPPPLPAKLPSSKCNRAELEAVQKKHHQCAKQVEERYAILQGRFTVDIMNLGNSGSSCGASLPAPTAVETTSVIPTSTHLPDTAENMCNMLTDLIDKCSLLYEKCYDSKQIR